MRATIQIIAAVMLFASSAFGYELKTTADGHMVRWHELPVAYVVDADGARDIDGLDAELAVHASFAAWTQVPGALVRFKRQPSRSGLEAGFDRTDPEANENVVVWGRDTWDHEPEAMAITLTVHRSGSGEIVDADIIVNEKYFVWTVGGENDLQNALTHEVGHALGMGHSAHEEATMYGSAEHDETHKRSLHDDDMDAARVLYDDPNYDEAINTYDGAHRDDAVSDVPPTQSDEEWAATPEAPSVGCSAVSPGQGTAPWALALFAMLLVALRRRSTRTAARRTALVAAAGVMMTATAAQATIAEGLDVEDLAVRASHVVEGEVLDTTVSWDGRLLYTYAEVQVDRCYKGACEHGVLTVRVLGGDDGEFTMSAAGMATFTQGERVLLFLEPLGAAAPDMLRVTGLAQGKFRLETAIDGVRAVRDQAGLSFVGPKHGTAEALRWIHLDRLIERLETELDR